MVVFIIQFGQVLIQFFTVLVWLSCGNKVGKIMALASFLMAGRRVTAFMLFSSGGVPDPLTFYAALDTAVLPFLISCLMLWAAIQYSLTKK